MEGNTMGQLDKKRKPQPFRRVQSELVFIDPRLKDNSFEAKGTEEMENNSWMDCRASSFGSPRYGLGYNKNKNFTQDNEEGVGSKNCDSNRGRGKGRGGFNRGERSGKGGFNRFDNRDSNRDENNRGGFHRNGNDRGGFHRDGSGRGGFHRDGNGRGGFHGDGNDRGGFRRGRGGKNNYDRRSLPQTRGDKSNFCNFNRGSMGDAPVNKKIVFNEDE